MEIKINVDESMFKNVLENELKALKPEEIHEVLVECIKNYFTQNNYENINKLLFEKNGAHYGPTIISSDFTKAMIESCDYSELQEIVNESIKILKNDYKNILNNILTDALIHGLVNSYTMTSVLRDTIQIEMNNKLYNENSGR